MHATKLSQLGRQPAVLRVSEVLLRLSSASAQLYCVCSHVGEAKDTTYHGAC